MEDKYWELKKQLPNPRNQEIINDFLLSLKLANYSKGTLVIYRFFLERFFGNREEPLQSISPEEIRNWLIENGKGKRESTHNLQTNVLNSLYQFCLEEGHIEKSPIKKRWFARLPKSLPKYVEKSDLAKTRRVMETDKLRERLLVEFMLASGCRVSEVHQLNKKDINMEECTAFVVGKKKIRQVHFNDKCQVLLERYLENHPFPESEALFVTSTGKRLSIRAIQHNIRMIGKKAEISTDLHPHRFRHTFATELVSKGAELSFIADELGHKDIDTTCIYARMPKQEIISSYRKFMG